MRRLISLAVSAALLVMIDWQIDARHLAEVIAGVDPGRAERSAWAWRCR